MKRLLTLKFLLSYLAFWIILLVLLGTVSQQGVLQYTTNSEAKKLYREANALATEYKDSFSTSSVSLPDLQNELRLVSQYISAEIWVADAAGNHLMDSSNPIIYENTLEGITYPIEGFSISDFGDSYYRVGTFYDSFYTDHLTVFSPITVGYKVRGYVLIHMPMVKIQETAQSISDFLFMTSSLVFGCSFIILIAYLIVVYRPMHKLTRAAKKYAKGEFTHRINFRSNDEFGYLANTMNFMATELDTLEEEQRKFISNVSHDFRSPLTSIKGYVEAMADGTIPPESQEKYLNIILFETERLNKLTQSILDLNRIGKHGMLLETTDFDINEVIRTTIQTFEHICYKKDLSFDLYLTGKELLVTADMGKIQQVLYNLIDNATKFSHNQSSITIETNVRNGKVFISVKDSGIGIPKDSIKRIWDRFYKTDLSRGKDKKGTGLGLAIVKEIVQAHNENINVVSTEGIGTEFIFTLPLSQKEDF